MPRAISLSSTSAIKAKEKLLTSGLTQQRQDQFAHFQNSEALKMVNQGIEKQLAVLNDRILQLANTLRSLTVQTPKAVNDTAKLMNNTRSQVVEAGL